MPDVKTFSLLDAVKGRSYPEDTVTIYTDVATAYEVDRLNAAANEAKDGDEANTFDAQLTVAKATLAASAKTVRMRGFAPGVSKSILKEAHALFKVEDGKTVDDVPEAFAWVNRRSIAEAIISVTDADGNVDDHHFTVEDIEALENYLPQEEIDKLSNKCYELSFKALAFDASVGSDF